MIYVDSPKFYGYTALRYKTWSHLWSDTSIEELHAMAEKLGLQRSWFQLKVGPTATEEAKLRRAHYDVVPSKRLQAIKLGAVPMEIGDWLEQRATAR